MPETVVNAHHDTALFIWKLGAPNTDTHAATGYDVVDFTTEIDPAEQPMFFERSPVQKASGPSDAA
ncbi:hypothetical protein ACIBF6_32240 [Streptosporangium amethystogenes]|uniref:hypothetical protein n=1 Tax=Streptosporangium amethystogenes TaxID=2002 RepID=UPI0037A1FF5F